MPATAPVGHGPYAPVAPRSAGVSLEATQRRDGQRPWRRTAIVSKPPATVSFLPGNGPDPADDPGTVALRRGGGPLPPPGTALAYSLWYGGAASRRKPHRMLRPPRRGPSSCRPDLTRHTSRSPPGSRRGQLSPRSTPGPRGPGARWPQPLRVARRDPGTSVPSGPSRGPQQPGARESRRPPDSHPIPDRKGVARWTSRTRPSPPSSPWSGTDPTPACRSSRRDAPPATPTTPRASSPILAPRCPATTWTS